MADQSIEPLLAKSAASGAQAIAAPVAVAVPKPQRPRPLGHLLEQEHILAGALLAPKLVILTLFMSYTFVLDISLEQRDNVVVRHVHFVAQPAVREYINDKILLLT